MARRIKEKVASISIFVISYGFNKDHDREGKGYYFSADDIIISESAMKQAPFDDYKISKIAEEFRAAINAEDRKKLPNAAELAAKIKVKLDEIK